MAELAKKRYKGIEFSEDFKMEESDFNKRFGDSHVFKKLSPQDKKKALSAAYLIASDKKVAPPKVEAAK